MNKDVTKNVMSNNNPSENSNPSDASASVSIVDPPQKKFPAFKAFHPFGFALGLGLIAMSVFISLGLYGYFYSIEEAREQQKKTFEEEACLLASLIKEHQSLSDEALLEHLLQTWQVLPDNPDDEYICIVDKNARLILHSAHPETVGNDTSGNLLKDRQGRSVSTLGELAQSGKAYMGDYVGSNGEEQLAAFVPVHRRDWILGVHRSKAGLEQECFEQIRFFVYALSGGCAVLLISLVILAFHNYRVIQKSLHSAKDAQRNERYLRSIIQTTTNGFWVLNLDGKIQNINNAYCQMSGYSRRELLKKSVSDVEAVESPEDIKQHMQKIQTFGTSVFETQHRHKDGHPYPLEISARYLPEEQQIVCFMRDLSPDREHQQALQESRREYRSLLENQPDIVMRFDTQGRHLFVSPNVEQLVKIPPTAFIGKTHRQMGFPEKDCLFWENNFQQVVQTGQPIETDFSFVNKDEEVIFNWRLIPEFNAKGEVTTILSIARNVTEYRSVQKDYQMLFEEMQNGFALHEIICDENDRPIDYRFLAVNPAFERLTGLNAKDLIGQRVLEVMPNTEKHWLDTYGRVALTGEPAHFENYAQALDKYFNVTAFCPEHGKFACLFDDITERIKSQNALEESEKRYRNLFRGAPVGVFVTTLEGKVISVNPTMATMLGFESPEQAVNHYDDLGKELYVNPEQREEFVQQLRVNGFVKNFEYEANCFDGEKIWISMDARIVDAPDQHDAFIEGFAADITARKKAEHLAQQNQRRMESMIAILESGAENVQQFLDNALEEAIRLTDSKIGYIFFYDEEKKEFALNSWSKDVLPQCSLPDLPFVYQLENTGLWGEAVRQRKPIVLNDYQASHTLKKGYPPGHAPLHKFLTIPVIIEGKIVAVIGVANKQTDYDQSDVLQLTILMDSIWHMADRKMANQKVLEEQKRAQQYLDIADVILLSLDTKGKIQLINAKGCEILGYPEEDILGKDWIENFVTPETRQRVRDIEAKVVTGEIDSVRYIENPVRTRSGEERLIAWRNVFLQDDEGNIIGTLSSGEDITERKLAETQKDKLEIQLRQSQKMEAVGQLAGGVAHDFNNLLQVILGYGDMLVQLLEPKSTNRDFAENIVEAGQQAKMLVSQLLTFSRQKELHFENLNLSDEIGDLVKMIHRFMGENISLELSLSDHLQTICADRGQIGQIIMNLCVNARDAMPEGGVITISTEEISLDNTFCETNTWARPGKFILLSVSDTGVGMDEETLEKIFEPFFTTKELGKGTGLGLSTVYGLIQEHNGLIHVQSRSGEGTVFRIYFPTGECRVSMKMDDSLPLTPSKGNETILLAEDDEMVQNICTSMLKGAGYKVLAASNGQEALEVFQKYLNNIDLAILDMKMPELDGVGVYQKINEERPDLPCIFASGYGVENLDKAISSQSHIQTIQKPYRRDELLKQIRYLLQK